MKTTREKLLDLATAADEIGAMLELFQKSAGQICSPLHLKQTVLILRQNYEIENAHIFLTETIGTLTVFIMFTANNGLCQCWYGHDVGDRAPEYKATFKMASDGLTA